MEPLLLVSISCYNRLQNQSATLKPVENGAINVTEDAPFTGI